MNCAHQYAHKTHYLKLSCSHTSVPALDKAWYWALMLDSIRNLLAAAAPHAHTRTQHNQVVFLLTLRAATLVSPTCVAFSCAPPTLCLWWGGKWRPQTWFTSDQLPRDGPSRQQHPRPDLYRWPLRSRPKADNAAATFEELPRSSVGNNYRKHVNNNVFPW